MLEILGYFIRLILIFCFIWSMIFMYINLCVDVQCVLAVRNVSSTVTLHAIILSSFNGSQLAKMKKSIPDISLP